ncbi:hypothetical protein HK102_006640, partial [Quaeritorhiza haematococci]
MARFAYLLSIPLKIKKDVKKPTKQGEKEKKQSPPKRKNTTHLKTSPQTPRRSESTTPAPPDIIVNPVDVTTSTGKGASGDDDEENIEDLLLLGALSNIKVKSTPVSSPKTENRKPKKTQKVSPEKVSTAREVEKVVSSEGGVETGAPVASQGLGSRSKGKQKRMEKVDMEVTSASASPAKEHKSAQPREPPRFVSEVKAAATIPPTEDREPSRSESKTPGEAEIVAQLKRELSTHRTKIASLERDKSNLEEQLARSQSELSAARSNQHDPKVFHDTQRVFTESLVKAQETARESQSRIKLLENECNNLRTQLQQAQQTLATHESTTAKLREENKDLRDSIGKLEDKARKHLEKMAEAREQGDLLAVRCADLEEKMKGAMERAEREVLEKEREWKERAEELEREGVNSIEKRLRALRDAVDAKEMEMGMLEKELKDARERGLVVEQERENLFSEKRRLEVNKEKVEEENAQLRREVGDLRRSLEEAEAALRRSERREQAPNSNGSEKERNIPEHFGLVTRGVLNGGNIIETTGVAPAADPETSTPAMTQNQNGCCSHPASPPTELDFHALPPPDDGLSQIQYEVIAGQQAVIAALAADLEDIHYASLGSDAPDTLSSKSSRKRPKPDDHLVKTDMDPTVHRHIQRGRKQHQHPRSSDSHTYTEPHPPRFAASSSVIQYDVMAGQQALISALAANLGDSHQVSSSSLLNDVEKNLKRPKPNEFGGGAPKLEFDVSYPDPCDREESFAQIQYELIAGQQAVIASLASDLEDIHSASASWADSTFDAFNMTSSNRKRTKPDDDDVVVPRERSRQHRPLNHRDVESHVHGHGCGARFASTKAGIQYDVLAGQQA